MPLAWAPDEDTAARAVLEKTRFALTGWKVMAELPNPVNFAAATASITTEQAKAQFACGPDVGRHLEVARQFADAGFDHLVAMNAGPDPDGFMDFFARQLAEPLRALQPGAGAVPAAPVHPIDAPGTNESAWRAWPGLAALPAASVAERAGALVPDLTAGFTACLAPWTSDLHGDHEAVGRAARRAAGRVLFYPVWMWHWARPGDSRVPWRRNAAHRNVRMEQRLLPGDWPAGRFDQPLSPSLLRTLKSGCAGVRMRQEKSPAGAHPRSQDWLPWQAAETLMIEAMAAHIAMLRQDGRPYPSSPRPQASRSSIRRRPKPVARRLDPSPSSIGKCAAPVAAQEAVVHDRDRLPAKTGGRSSRSWRLSRARGCGTPSRRARQCDDQT